MQGPNIAAALVAGLWVSVASMSVHAQLTPVGNRRVEREAPAETPITLVAKIKRAHLDAVSHAQELATYVTRNTSNLSNATMRAHCDAIGSALDDALHFSTKLSEKLQSDAANKHVLLMGKHDKHAKQIYRTLLEKLRGSSVTAPEIRMMAVQIQQDIAAAEQALAQVPVANTADAGTR